jgi:GH43 family beta-xylosidase
MDSDSTYLNPVYCRSCPDPFVIKHKGEYWCFSTGWAHDGRVFEILHSHDLIHWEPRGGAMEALPGGAREYWAPEVNYNYKDGRFYLYYSVGDGVQMKLRAAVSDRPAGPFQDAGRQLVPDDFAIDPHVFEDDDGTAYLFYAVDFLQHTHVGTGTVCDRMLDPLTLEGLPRPVTRPKFDWQVFDPHRVEKGGVRWHTVEGPFVLKHKDRYYQMFSGGNWQNASYGVSFAVADSMHSQQEWTQLEHNESIPLVLATIPQVVIGPGHNSVVRGPDNRQLYCVYHRWSPEENARLLSLDRLEWIGDRIAVLGPSTSPQPMPTIPARPVLNPVSGVWNVEDGRFIQSAEAGGGEADLVLTASCFVAEVTCTPAPRDFADRAEYGLAFFQDSAELARLKLLPGRGFAVAWDGEAGHFEQVFPLITQFRYDCAHLVRAELDGRNLTLLMDGATRLWEGRLKSVPNRLACFSSSVPCVFEALSLTYGFENRFEGAGMDPSQIGWSPVRGPAGRWRIDSGEMRQTDPEAQHSLLIKDHAFASYELVANAHFDTLSSSESSYGFSPACDHEGRGPLVKISGSARGPVVEWECDGRKGSWPLRMGFEPRRSQQFRFQKRGGEFRVCQGAEYLGRLQAPSGPCRVALYAHQASVGFDLVRLTSF